jgi:hypothetical protein
MSYIDILFDGPPGPTSGRFVEVEDANRASVDVGNWLQREDGYWVLRVPMLSRDLQSLASQWEIDMAHTNNFPSPAAKYPDLRAFHLGVCGEGEHSYNWEDKPHRLVYDLTRMVAELRDQIRDLAKDKP